MSLEVRFVPGGVAVEATGPLLVRDAAARRGLWIEEPCGGTGSCTGCRVRFHDGAPAPRPVERELLGPEAVDSGWRLACQATIERSAVVEVPERPDAIAKSFGPEVLTGEDEPAATGQAIAVDLGSTTIAAALVDRRSTKVLACASELNQQVRFGEDVIARVLRAREGERRELEAALSASVRAALAALGPHEAAFATVCGNPVLTHFLVEADPEGLGEAPFAHAFRGPQEQNLDALGGLRVRTFPLIGGHVGGDAVAAALACGLDRCTGPAALIDLGTNCEVVLATPGSLWATSAAAGPAFEGGGITDGMRAAPGAIDRVRLGNDGELAIHVHGSGEPLGLCGTGLVDAVAALLETGVVDPSGRLCTRSELDPRHREHLEDGLRGDHAYRLEGGGPHRVRLTARDVRALQVAKAAITAALELLLRHARLRMEELETIHLCGSFGARIPIASLRRLGILDRIPPARVRFAGDAAAVGARMAACSERAWARALELAARTEHVDLTNESDYVETFARAMAFPARDGTRRTATHVG